MSSPAPAARAAGPNAANTPAPIIDPSPITTASTVPSRRDSSGIPEPFYQCVKIRLFSNSAPPTLTASHSRPERGGNSAGAAVSQTVNGKSRLMEVDRGLSRAAGSERRCAAGTLARRPNRTGGNRCHTIRKLRWHRIPGPGALPVDVLDAKLATTEGPGVDVGQPHANLIMLVDVTATPLVSDLR